MSIHPLARRADDPTPLYYRFQQHLRERIRRGEWAPGARLPAEPDLAREYGISRGTIREGLDVLEREGLIERRHGYGTYVRDARIVADWNTSLGFMPSLRALGHKVDARPVSVQLRKADADVAGWLDSHEGEPIVQIRRVILADDEPFLVTTAYLAEQRCPGLTEVDFSHEWLFETLERRYGLRIAKQERWLEPVTPNPRDQRDLGLPRPIPCLLVDELSRAADGTPVSFSKTIVRGDRCRPHFRLDTR